jgi:hypothetical protein
MRMIVIWNIGSTYELPICGQSMIIWHMANSLAGVSMVDSIVQCVWMNLMHSGFSTVGKSISLIVIEDSVPWVMSSVVTKSHFRKSRELEKGHQSESSDQISWKCSVILRSHRMVSLKVQQKAQLDSLMQRHWYYPHNVDLMHQERNIAESITTMCFDVTGFSKDNINAWKDLSALCNHHSLEPRRTTKENLKRPHAPYCLKLTEQKVILRWLKKLKFPYRYVSNI